MVVSHTGSVNNIRNQTAAIDGPWLIWTVGDSKELHQSARISYRLEINHRLVTHMDGRPDDEIREEYARQLSEVIKRYREIITNIRNGSGKLGDEKSAWHLNHSYVSVINVPFDNQ